MILKFDYTTISIVIFLIFIISKSWNVAGLRGTLKKNPKVLDDLVDKENPDILCLQVKANSSSHIYSWYIYIDVYMNISISICAFICMIVDLLIISFLEAVTICFKFHTSLLVERWTRKCEFHWFQETKLQNIGDFGDLLVDRGYKSYWTYSEVKKGYAGTVRLKFWLLFPHFYKTWCKFSNCEPFIMLFDYYYMWLASTLICEINVSSFL